MNPDKLYRAHGLIVNITPDDDKCYTIGELRALIRPNGRLFQTNANANYPDLALVMDKEADPNHNSLASEIVGYPVYGDVLLVRRNRLPNLTEKPNAQDATGTTTVTGPAPMTVKRLTSAQAEARKTEIAKEITSKVSGKYKDTCEVEVFRLSFNAENLEKCIKRAAWHVNGNITGTGPYLTVVTQWGRPVHMARGETELKSLKAMLKSLGSKNQRKTEDEALKRVFEAFEGKGL
jgi:hypothetical protein